MRPRATLAPPVAGWGVCCQSLANPIIDSSTQPRSRTHTHPWDALSWPCNEAWRWTCGQAATSVPNTFPARGTPPRLAREPLAEDLLCCVRVTTGDRLLSCSTRSGRLIQVGGDAPQQIEHSGQELEPAVWPRDARYALPDDGWQSMCYPHRYHPLTCLQALAVVRVAARATPRVGRAPEPGLRRRSSASRCSRRYLPRVCTAARRRCREHLRFEFHLELEVWRLCPFNWACARTLRQKKNHSKRSNWRRTVDV